MLAVGRVVLAVGQVVLAVGRVVLSWLAAIPAAWATALFAMNGAEAYWPTGRSPRRRAASARRYRELRFDALAECPRCHGAGGITGVLPCPALPRHGPGQPAGRRASHGVRARGDTPPARRTPQWRVRPEPGLARTRTGPKPPVATNPSAPPAQSSSATTTAPTSEVVIEDRITALEESKALPSTSEAISEIPTAAAGEFPAALLEAQPSAGENRAATGIGPGQSARPGLPTRPGQPGVAAHTPRRLIVPQTGPRPVYLAPPVAPTRPGAPIAPRAGLALPSGLHDRGP